MPERIVTFKAAVGGHNVAAFLYGRLAFAYGYVVDVQVVRREQRAFAAKFGVLNQFHNM